MADEGEGGRKRGRCPKCGEDNWFGPSWSVVAGEGERMIYTCGTCGFAQKEPARDAPAPYKSFSQRQGESRGFADNRKRRNSRNRKRS